MGNFFTGGPGLPISFDISEYGLKTKGLRGPHNFVKIISKKLKKVQKQK